jgi:hypothetical protein
MEPILIPVNLPTWYVKRSGTSSNARVNKSVRSDFKEALINAIPALSERGSRKVSFSTALQINGLTPLIWRHIYVHLFACNPFCDSLFQ